MKKCRFSGVFQQSLPLCYDFNFSEIKLRKLLIINNHTLTNRLHRKKALVIEKKRRNARSNLHNNFLMILITNSFNHSINVYTLSKAHLNYVDDFKLINNFIIRQIRYVQNCKTMHSAARGVKIVTKSQISVLSHIISLS